MQEWQIVLFVLLAILVALLVVITLKCPKRVKEWLLYAVIEAEKQMGTGTGIAKLHLVYDWFLARFPKISYFVAFETFSKWVDLALDKMKELLEEKQKLKEYVNE